MPYDRVKLSLRFISYINPEPSRDLTSQCLCLLYFYFLVIDVIAESGSSALVAIVLATG